MSLATGGVQSGLHCEVKANAKYECLVGRCPTVDVLLGEIPVRCLLDTGSNVSTITESFFEQHFCPTLKNGEWLAFSAVNGLGIPYLGYFEKDVRAPGKTVKGREILVVRDPLDAATLNRAQAVLCILGMNLIKQFYEVEQLALGIGQGSGPPLVFDDAWGLAFAVCQQEQVVSGVGFACSTVPFSIPAGSMCFVPVAVPSGLVPTGSYMFVESLGAGEGSLPGELLVSGALVPVENAHMAVPLLNVGGVNISIEPRTRLGLVHTVDVVACDTTSVAFELVAPQEELVLVSEQAGEVVEQQELPAEVVAMEFPRLNGEQIRKVRQLLGKHAGVFAKLETDWGCTNVIEHEIPVVDEAPVRQRYRQYEKVKAHIVQLLQHGIIRESSSPYCSPLVIVRKKMVLVL